MRMADNVYAVLGLAHPIGVNAGFVVTERSVVAIDSSLTYWSALTILGYIEAVAKENPTKRLILTEGHSDHIFGACAFKERGYTIIAHKKVPEYVRACVKEHGVNYVEQMVRNRNKLFEEAFGKVPQGFTMGEALYSKVELIDPEVLIDREVKLTVDGQELLVTPTPGHTETNLCVYLPRTRILFAGDTLYSGYPPITRFATRELQRQWIESLERLKSLDIHLIIPGHGPPCGREVIDKHIQYLETLTRN